jgi:hypothetical protein
VLCDRACEVLCDRTDCDTTVRDQCELWSGIATANEARDRAAALTHHGQVVSSYRVDLAKWPTSYMRLCQGKVFRTCPCHALFSI